MIIIDEFHIHRPNEYNPEYIYGRYPYYTFIWNYNIEQ